MIKLRVKKLKTDFEKTKGLIGENNIEPTYFETRFGIHTIGMTKPIDVYILNKEFKIVKIRKDLKPGNLFFWNPKYFRVLELPANLIKAKIGDQLTLLQK